MKTASVLVKSGNHQRHNCPAHVVMEAPGAVPGAAASGGKPAEDEWSWQLTDPTGRNEPLPAQRDESGFRFILPEMPAGEEKRLLLAAVEPGSGSSGIEVREEGDLLTISRNGGLFTAYHFSSDRVRPFFYPVMGPWNLEMTRAWPVVEGIEGEETDHVHHKSLWAAHGLINGCDHWSEEEGRGRQIHKSFDSMETGPVFGGFQETLVWETSDGKPLVDEKRTFRIWNITGAETLFDLAVAFTAAHGNVEFGDTKEGGICSLRVPEAMKGKRGGKIENAYGGIGEKECWGKRSPWVDYSGTVKDHNIGITMMDHPMNPRYPTFWHVRDYGLFSANPFRLSYFKSSYRKRGDWMLPGGEEAVFKYRLLFHPGDAGKGRSAGRFNDWANPPSAETE